ncbi:MAG: hypothetical protein GY727_14725, partial [Gammaproteobacteria bacterium]|nr:hypothetical protein [Gammaproteobacteria bacterium]
ATAAAIGITGLVGAAVGSKSASKARKAQSKASDKAISTTQQATRQAREDLFKLFPAAQQNVQQGFQGALDVFGQSLPAQSQAFQQGNIGAQQTLLAGLPQQQAAILGGNIDYSQLQASQPQNIDLGFFQQQLPQFTDPYNQTPDEIAASMGTGTYTPPVSVNNDIAQGNSGFVGPSLGGGFGGFNKFNDSF